MATENTTTKTDTQEPKKMEFKDVQTLYASIYGIPAAQVTMEMASPYIGYDLKTATDFIKEAYTFKVERDKAAEEARIAQAERAAMSIWKQDDGNLFLVKFSSDPNAGDQGDESTIWLFNKQEKTYRPFLSPDSIKNGFKNQDFAEVMKRLNVLPASAVTTDPDIWGGTFLSKAKAVQNDGSIPYNMLSFDAEIPTYGKNRVPDMEGNTAALIDLTLKQAIDNGYISQGAVDEIAGGLSTSGWLKSAVGASLYGGYGEEGILMDIKARELALAGNSAYNSLQGFSNTLGAEAYRNTQVFTAMKNDPNLAVPQSLRETVGEDVMNLSIGDLPSEFWQNLVDPINWKSEEGKAEADNIKAEMFDAAMKLVQGKTEGEKAAAYHDWDVLRESIERKYGLKLKDNVAAAWDQIDKMFTGYSNREMLHSGFMNREFDKAMKAVRANNDEFRKSKKTELEAEELGVLRSHGFSADREAYVAKYGEAKAISAGLKPDPNSEFAKYWTIDNLQKLNPEMTPDEVKSWYNTVLDDNGYWLSRIESTANISNHQTYVNKKDYQDLMSKKNNAEREDMANDEVTPSTSLAGSTSGVGDTETPAGSPIADSTTAFPPEQTSPGREYIATEADLAARREELKALGIPESEYGKYISSPTPGDKRLWYTAPTTAPTPAGQSAELTQMSKDIYNTPEGASSKLTQLSKDIYNTPEGQQVERTIAPILKVAPESTEKVTPAPTPKPVADADKAASVSAEDLAKRWKQANQPKQKFVGGIMQDQASMNQKVMAQNQITKKNFLINRSEYGSTYNPKDWKLL